MLSSSGAGGLVAIHKCQLARLLEGLLILAHHPGARADLGEAPRCL